MHRLKQITLLVGDLVCLYFSLFLAVIIRSLSYPTPEVIEQLITPMSLLFLVAAIILFIAGLYDLSLRRSDWKFFRKIPIAALIWMAIGVVYFYIRPEQSVSPKTILVLNTILGFSLLTLWRLVYNRYISTNLLRNKVIFLGFNPEALEIAEILEREPHHGYEAVSLVEPLNEQINSTANIQEILPTTAFLPIEKNLDVAIEKIRNNTSDIIIVVAPTVKQNQKLLQQLYNKFFENIAIVELDKFYEELTGRIPPFTFSENWFLSNFQEQNKKIYDRFKLIVDYFFAIIIGAVNLVLFLPTAAAIKLTAPGPIFFKQTRLGKNGKEFTIYKYRTMRALAADGSAEVSGPQFAQIKDSRITPVGNFLRKTRIDELPQFINILRGEMSLIGPRPERPKFVNDLVTEMPFYRLRLLVKPGISGWAQIQQGYAGNRDENLRKLEYDLYYIKNRGPWLDLSIILRTVNTLAGMKGR